MPIKGKIVVDDLYCKACELCVNVCPTKVLDLAQDRLTSRGYHPAEMIGDDCTGCAICAVVCPEAAITVYREIPQTKEKKILQEV